MPTIIDSLVVELGIDPKKFVGGQKEFEAALKKLIENAGKGSAEIERRTKSTIDYFDRLKTGVLTTLGLFLGGKGFRDFLHHVSGADAATGRFAATVQLGIKEMGAWEKAIEAMGGSADDAKSAMGGLVQDIKDFNNNMGGGEFVKIMNALEVDVRGKKPDQILLEAAAGAKRRHPTDTSEQFYELMKIPGMNRNMANLLMLPQAEIQQRLAAGRAAAPSPKDFEQAKEYQRATAQFNSAVERFSASVSYFSSGFLAKFFEGLTDVISGKKDAPTVAGEWHTDLSKSLFSRVQGWLGSLGDTQLPSWMSPQTSPLEFLKKPPGPLNPMPQMPKLSKLGSNTDPIKPHLVPTISIKPLASVQDQEAYIRQAARARGIDPNKAVAYARSQSGGMAAGRAAEFNAATGLDASDLSTWSKQVDWMLDQVQRDLAIGAGAAGGRGGSSRSSTSTVNINTINVNAPNATDATGVARDISSAIKRSALGAPVNFGQE